MTKEKEVTEQANSQDLAHEEYNSRGRGRSEAKKRESYDRYRKNKLMVLDAERRNRQFLVLYPASDADTNENRFYNMGGNSAVIYVHEIAPRLRRKAKLRRDMDICKESEKFHSGICSIMDLVGLEERLKTIGVKRVKSKGELVFFKLAREYSQDEIKGMLRLEQKKLDDLNKLLYADVLYPKMHRGILELKRIIPMRVKDMHKIYRDVVGMDMMQSLMALVKNYGKMARGHMKPEVAMLEMQLECDELLSGISMMNELRVWDVDVCAKIGEIVVRLTGMLDEELCKIGTTVGA